MMEALDRRRKERVKGRRKMKERVVWESLRLSMEKSGERGEMPEARKSDRRRAWSNGRRDEEAMRGGERRVEAAKGRRRREGVEERWWKFLKNVKMDFLIILDGLILDLE